jgi:hypothetical protein
MFFFISSQRSEAGPELIINCPICHARGVEASTYQLSDELTKSNWVICDGCDAHLISSRSIFELPDLTEEELDRVIKPHTSFIFKTLAVLSILIGLAPIVGFVVGLAAVLGNRRTGFWNIVSWIGFAMGLVSGAFTVAILINHK